MVTKTNMTLTKEQEEKLREEWNKKFIFDNGQHGKTLIIGADFEEIPDYWLSKINQIRDEALTAQRKEIVEAMKTVTRYQWKDVTGGIVTVALGDILSLPQLQVNEETDDARS